MSKTTKTLLTLSLVGLVSGLIFVTGIVNVENAVAWYITLPMGAIFFGLFLISKLLEKEVALHDAEQALMLASAQKVGNSSAGEASCRKPVPARQGSLVSAH